MLYIQDGEVEGCALIFSYENSKNTTRCWTTIHRRMLDPTTKDTPHPRAKEKSQEDRRRVKIAFRIKPHTRQRHWEGSNLTLCTTGNPTETEPDLPLSVWVWRNRSAAAEVAIDPTIELLELAQDWGNRLLEGTNKTLWAPRGKERWPHKRLAQTCPWVSRNLQRRRGSVVACCRVRDTECHSACRGSFEGGCHYLHYSTPIPHSLASGQTTGKEHRPAHQKKIGLKICWARPCPSEQDPVSPPSQSLLPGGFHKPLIFIHQREAWKSQSQKATEWSLFISKANHSISQ